VKAAIIAVIYKKQMQQIIRTDAGYPTYGWAEGIYLIVTYENDAL
jgi:hypothetical protein